MKKEVLPQQSKHSAEEKDRTANEACRLGCGKAFWLTDSKLTLPERLDSSSPPMTLTLFVDLSF